MAERKIELELPEELFAELDRIAEALGMASAVDTATFGLTEWIWRRKAELDDRDPQQQYFVNEALDALIRDKKS